MKIAAAMAALALTGASLGLVAAPGAASASTTFQFLFDNNGPGPTSVAPPYVGSGTFTLTNDPGDGTFALDTLGAFHFKFTLDGVTFKRRSLDTPLSEILVVISSTPDGQRIQFSNTDPFGSGPFGGSIDLINRNGNFLTFEPPAFGEGLNLYEAGNLGETNVADSDGRKTHILSPLLGNYEGLAPEPSVPEPATWLMLVLGFGGLGAMMRRRRTAATSLA